MARPLYFLGLFCLLIVMGTSCVSTQKSTYFYNAQDTSFLSKLDDMEPPIQKNDILSISISSLNPEASAIFNSTNNFSTNTTSSTGTTNTTGSGYLVNSDGFIQLPILGNVKAAGITKKQLKADITNSILDKKLLLDPIVNIRHLNYEVTVIGEVANPTVITVPNERISLIKALGLAGDITVYGKKDNVLLIREIDGKRNIRRIDLNSRNFLTSPYYYLQPNDVIYVEANKDKVAQANRSQQQLLPTILSGLSIIAIVVTQLVK